MIGSLKLGDDGAIEFFADKHRSDPKNYEAHWKDPKPPEITITTSIPVFANEDSLEVGFLTAAYGLWFKNFGYSFVLQSNLDIVREQIQKPSHRIMNWNYLIEIPAREIRDPKLGLIRFGKDYFPFAVIYDHIILLPSAEKLHPESANPDRISNKVLNLKDTVSARYQHRCVGPAVLLCDGQAIIRPDLIPDTTIPPQNIQIAGWP